MQRFVLEVEDHTVPLDLTVTKTTVYVNLKRVLMLEQTGLTMLKVRGYACTDSLL